MNTSWNWREAKKELGRYKVYSEKGGIRPPRFRL